MPATETTRPSFALRIGQREIQNPILRGLAAVFAFGVFLPLTVLWTGFWSVTTYPVHVAMRLAGGKGFLNGDEYSIPIWSMLLVSYVAICLIFGI